MVSCEKVTDHNKWGSGHTWPPKLAGTDELVQEVQEEVSGQEK